MGIQVAIVGAGIAGLAAAVGLRKAGHEVTVFEKSKFKKEIGAAVTITPNGTRILDSWGFDFGKARRVEGQFMTMYHNDTLKIRFTDDFDRITKAFGYPMGLYHRVDIHNELRRLAESLGAQIELGNLVEDVTPEGVLKVKDGRTVTADLVVIADGVHSEHIKTVTGKEEPLLSSGRSAIRALVSVDKAKANPEVAPYFVKEEPGWNVPCTMPPHPTQMIIYPVRNDEVLNIGILHDTIQGYENIKDWHCPIPFEDAKRSIDGFHPACAELLSLSDDLNIYALTRRDVLPNYVNGRLVLIGDAAHAMPPTHTQGAVSCIEDACALSVFLGNLDDRDKVSERLKLHESVVKPRMQTTQLLSLATPGQHDQYRQQAEEMWEKPGWGELYPDGAMYHSQPISNYFYSYDIRAEAEKIMYEGGYIL